MPDKTKIFLSIPVSKYPKVTERRTEKMRKIVIRLFSPHPISNIVVTAYPMYIYDCDIAIFYKGYMRYPECKAHKATCKMYNKAHYIYEGENVKWRKQV